MKGRPSKRAGEEKAGGEDEICILKLET